MSDEIFGDRFLGRDVPAWHKLGTTFDLEEALDPEEAVRRAGCAYGIHKLKLPSVEHDGELVPVPLYGIIRDAMDDDPQARFFGAVSEDYTVFDNLAIARVVKELAKSWPVETVGALGQGERFFLSLKVGRTTLNGSDNVDRYFLLHGNHGNNRAVYLRPTTVRVVCANTLQMALAGTGNITIEHTSLIEEDARIATALVARAEKADESVIRQLERLAAASVTDRQVNAILAAAYPEPKAGNKTKLSQQADAAGISTESMKRAIKAHEAERAQTFIKRATALQCYRRLGDQFPDIRGTAWCALNAVTELENHRGGRDNAEESILIGMRGAIMDRALKTASAVAQEVIRS